MLREVYISVFINSLRNFFCHALIMLMSFETFFRYPLNFPKLFKTVHTSAHFPLPSSKIFISWLRNYTKNATKRGYFGRIARPRFFSSIWNSIFHFYFYIALLNRSEKKKRNFSEAMPVHRAKTECEKKKDKL